MLKRILVVTAVAALVGLPADSATAAPPGYPVTGIDVSNHQRTINWASVAAAGAKFSYAKASESTSYTDPYFNANNAGAKANGLYAGAYHFALPDRSSGRAQADFFLDRAQFVNDGRTLPPMLDIEWPWSGSGSPSPCYGLSPSQMVSWIHDFLNRVRERTGRMALIYTNTNWWNPCTGSNTSFGAYPLFIANYTSSPTPLPAGWSSWTFWQYSDSGALPGDQDVFNGSLSALARFASGGRATTSMPVSAADFTGDGKADIGAQYVNGQMRVAASTGDLSADLRMFSGSFPLVGSGWNSSNVERIVVGDFTGDGKADVGAQYVNGQLRVWAGTGDLSADLRLFSGNGALVGTGWNSANVERIVVGDFTGDGKDDIGAQYVNGQMRVAASTGDLSADLRMFSGSFPLVGSGWNSANVQRIVVGDFTGDGKADIGAQYVNGQLRIWASTGDLSADLRLFTGNGALVGTGWNSANVERILVGDFTGDGKTDIGAQYVNGQMRVAASTGDLSADLRMFSGSFPLVGSGWNSSNVERIVTGDFTGDGKSDIGAQYVNGQLRIWAGTGDLSSDLRLFAGNGALVGTGWNSANVERIL